MTSTSTAEVGAPESLVMDPMELQAKSRFTMPSREQVSISQTVALQSLTAAPDFTKLATILENKLKNNVVGYSFVLSHQNNYKASRSGGQSRQAQDAPARNMTMVDKYSIASVSKAITAAACMNALRTFSNNISTAMDMKIAAFLPTHWTLGANINTISFRELLTHSSGIRTGGNNCSYQSLKAIIAGGVSLANKGRMYDNNNFALLRILIPKMMCYPVTSIGSNESSFSLLIKEAQQASEFANAYKDYCHKSVLDKLENAFGAVDCANSQANPALYYAFPKGADKGCNVGDLTLASGGQGWVMSTLEMADFFRRLHYTELILPKAITEVMKKERAGYDNYAVTNDGVIYYSKNGIYNSGNAGYRSVIIGFADDVQMAIMTNSICDLTTIAIQAHQDWKV